jgi:DNA-binding transcriptional MerR regulator
VKQEEASYSIQELANLAGVSRRTVRYYVQRGLLQTPLGTGRGRHYTQAHLERLVEIRTLQEQGVSLSEIRDGDDSAEQKTSTAPSVSPVPQSVWLRLELTEGVELHLKGDKAALPPKQRERLIKAVMNALCDEPSQQE